MKPLVSIVIPVYNGENYLKEAVDSALAQTYGFVEVLVVNDGSEDKTEEIALSYGDEIRYLAKGNGGVSTALNLGLAAMRGEYFSWLSHDDLYRPEKIALEMAELSGDPTRIVYSDYAVIDQGGATLATMDIAKKYPGLDLTFGLFPILRQVLNGCSMLIHKSHFARAGVFDERLRVTQDYDLWFRMLRGRKLAYVNKPLVMLREHGAQVMHNHERSRAESDELWLNMLGSLTAEEACEIDGTERDFWDRQAEFLRYTRYKKAKAYAEKRLEALGGGSVSLAKLVNRAVYEALSGLSGFMGAIGLRNPARKCGLYNYGYKIWFGVRYR